MFESFSMDDVGNDGITVTTITGLDIGYVPAGPDAFFRWSGQFAGPVDFFF